MLSLSIEIPLTLTPEVSHANQGRGNLASHFGMYGKLEKLLSTKQVLSTESFHSLWSLCGAHSWVQFVSTIRSHICLEMLGWNVGLKYHCLGVPSWHHFVGLDSMLLQRDKWLWCQTFDAICMFVLFFTLVIREIIQFAECVFFKMGVGETTSCFFSGSLRCTSKLQLC